MKDAELRSMLIRSGAIAPATGIVNKTALRKMKQKQQLAQQQAMQDQAKIALREPVSKHFSQGAKQ